MELLWLLLPVAAASGWWAARRSGRGDSAPGSRNTVPSGYFEGLDFLLSNQSDKALKAFLDMVDGSADTVENHLILGSLYRRRGEVDRAILIHQNLIERRDLEQAQKASALTELGRDYFQAGLLDQAERLFYEVLDLGLQRGPAYEQLRRIYEQERDWSKAIWASEQLAEHSAQPQNTLIAHYHCELGEAARASGAFADAKQHARRALSFDRDCVRASLLLGSLARDEKNPRLAIEHYRRVLRQDPNFVALVLEPAGEAFTEASDEAGFEHFLREMRAVDASINSSLQLVGLLARRGRKDGLEQLLDEEMREENASLRMILEYLRFKGSRRLGGRTDCAAVAAQALERFVRHRPQFHCVHCGFRSQTHFWCCPGCQGWSTIRPVAKGPLVRADPLFPKP